MSMVLFRYAGCLEADFLNFQLESLREHKRRLFTIELFQLWVNVHRTKENGGLGHAYDMFGEQLFRIGEDEPGVQALEDRLDAVMYFVTADQRELRVFYKKPFCMRRYPMTFQDLGGCSGLLFFVVGQPHQIERYLHGIQRVHQRPHTVDLQTPNTGISMTCYVQESQTISLQSSENILT